MNQKETYSIQFKHPRIKKKQQFVLISGKHNDIQQYKCKKTFASQIISFYNKNYMDWLRLYSLGY